MVKYAHLIPLFPFLAFAINILFGRKLKRASALVSIAASSAALLVAAVTFAGNLNGEGSYTIAKWLSFNGTPLDFGVTIDPLSCMMLLVVTIVGTLIQIYSIGYMHDDPRFSRFFAYMSLFMGSMLGLLLADNFVMLSIFWEGLTPISVTVVYLPNISLVLRTMGVTNFSTGAPLRSSVILMAPAECACIRAVMSSQYFTGFPSTDNILSPTSMPAFSAG